VRSFQIILKDDGFICYITSFLPLKHTLQHVIYAFKSWEKSTWVAIIDILPVHTQIYDSFFLKKQKNKTRTGKFTSKGQYLNGIKSTEACLNFKLNLKIVCCWILWLPIIYDSSLSLLFSLSSALNIWIFNKNWYCSEEFTQNVLSETPSYFVWIS